jgi:putative FmdB family regulatory protein
VAAGGFAIFFAGGDMVVTSFGWSILPSPLGGVSVDVRRVFKRVRGLPQRLQGRQVGVYYPPTRSDLMPHYVFLCKSCNKEFTRILPISELEKSDIKCPHCGSQKVQQQVAAFSAVTSKKS